jgi:ubiquinone/menaquinone biosynthesis C-methylase UbiE
MHQPHRTTQVHLLADELRELGFEQVSFERLSLGIVAIHIARKPPARPGK